MIEIDIPNRTIHLAVSEDELADRRAEQDQGAAGSPPRSASAMSRTALRAYAAMATSADKGAVRHVPE